MNPRQHKQVSAAAGAVLALLVPFLGGCVAPDLNATADPVVVTENGTVSYAKHQSSERLAAIADMRAQGEAGEAMPYPDVFQASQTTRLAAREEPRSVPDADSVEMELAAIARRQKAAISQREIAELEARAVVLRRMAAEAQAGRRP